MYVSSIRILQRLLNVNNVIQEQANFVKMLFCKNDTVMLMLLQNKVNLINH